MNALVKVLSLAAGLLALSTFFGAGPALANDAGRIAFFSLGSNSGDVVTVGASGGDLFNVTQGRLAGISTFAWSPDGTRLVVSADRGSNLYVVNADGTDLRRITNNAGFAITQTPTWSPDGESIAYVGNGEQNYDVFLIKPDGNGQRRLTNTNSIYRDLAWSPDGTRIAYASGPDFFNVKIHVMNADGTGSRQVSTGQGSDLAPAWSPDGSRIAYENDYQFGPAEIFVMNADGGNQQRLTTDFRADRHPTWSPDGTKIAFTSDREGTSAVFVMNADGSGQTRITTGSTTQLHPAWQPTGAAPQPTPTPAQTYSVKGRVVDGGGNAVAGATVTFELNQSGNLSTKSAVTDAAGNYSSGELGCQNGVGVVPAKSGYTFNPSRLGFVSTRCLNGSDTADFVAVSDSTPRYSITGRVTDGSGVGIPDATVTLSGTQTGTVLTDAAGNYSFTGLLAGGDYLLSPSKTGQYLRFSRSVSNLSSNLVIDLTLMPYVNVNVRVTNASGAGVSGVSIERAGQLGSPQTNASGVVSINVVISSAGNTQITLTPVKYGYSFEPKSVTFNSQDGNQSFSFTAKLGNRIDDPQFFVTQHYRDFFNREPDAPGLAFWTGQITSCGNALACIDYRRANTSGAYFLSTEFQETGYLVYRLHKAAFGNLNGKPVPVTFQRFMPDTQQVGEGVVVGSDGWQQKIETNKRAFLNAFVERAEFKTLYPAGMSGTQFVDTLNLNTDDSLTKDERDALIADLAANRKSRADVLWAVAENKAFSKREYNRAFVLMQYFGYLRRNPDDLPDGNFAGYEFWLNKLEEFGGDFHRAEMVRAFLLSGEYRERFVQP